jgi:predicted alpha/beta superfamily hydrolase
MSNDLVRPKALSRVAAAVTLACTFASAAAVAAPANDSNPLPPGISRTADSGALIEPSRRMRFEGGPWEYEIRIALPPSYRQSDKSYPVLWVTDGGFQFEQAVDVVNSSTKNHVPDMIVVSIGTPSEARNESLRRRAYDFSFTTADICTGQEPGASLYEQLCKSVLDQIKSAGMPAIDHLGGAPQLLKFIVGDLRSKLVREYRMSNDNTLFGYSVGGSFCTYALLARPDGFDRYICGSPNLNFDGGMVFKMEQQYAASHKDMRAKVFFSAGEGEMLQGGMVSATGIVGWMARMAEILKVRGYPSLELHARILPGEVHDGSGARMSLYWGLRTLMATGI